MNCLLKLAWPSSVCCYCWSLFALTNAMAQGRLYLQCELPHGRLFCCCSRCLGILLSDIIYYSQLSTILLSPLFRGWQVCIWFKYNPMWYLQCICKFISSCWINPVCVKCLCLSADTTPLATQMPCWREWSSMHPKSEPPTPAVQLLTTTHTETFLRTWLFTVTLQCDSAAFIRVHRFFVYIFQQCLSSLFESTLFFLLITMLWSHVKH